MKSVGGSFEDQKAEEVARNLLDRFLTIVASNTVEFAESRIFDDNDFDDEEPLQVESTHQETAKMESSETVQPVTQETEIKQIPIESADMNKSSEIKQSEEEIESDDEYFPEIFPNEEDVSQALKFLGIPVYGADIEEPVSSDEGSEEDSEEESEYDSEYSSEEESNNQIEYAEEDPESTIFDTKSFTDLLEVCTDESVNFSDLNAVRLAQTAAENFFGQLLQHARVVSATANRKTASAQDLEAVIQIWTNAPGACMIAKRMNN